MRKKANDIAGYLSKFEVIPLQETWIEEKFYPRTEHNLPTGYNWIWSEAVREKARGRPAGGLVFGLRKELEYKLGEGNKKGCWASVDVRLGGVWFLIVMVYNNTNLDFMKNELNDFLLKNLHKRVIIGGDLKDHTKQTRKELQRIRKSTKKARNG